MTGSATPSRNAVEEAARLWLEQWADIDPESRKSMLVHADFVHDVCTALCATSEKRKPDGEFTVGAYTLSAGMENGKVWIEHETGEGGDFTASKVEAAIAAYYKENF